MSNTALKFWVRSFSAGCANVDIFVGNEKHQVKVICETTIDVDRKSIKITGAKWAVRPPVDLANCDITAAIEIAIENELR